MSVEENRETERRFIEEVIKQQNLATADELVAEDVVELDPCDGFEVRENRARPKMI
jgi:hypothetical protein